MSKSLGDFYESITESSSTVRRGSLTLLAVGTYLLATAAEITHVQLVISDQQINLPLINIPVDLEKFYFIAPIIFICLQIKFTIQLFAHQDRVNLIRKKLSKKHWHKEKKLFLPIALFNLSQYSSFNQKYITWLLNSIFFVSTTIFPVAVLIFFQASFVPYHDAFYTTVHQMFCTLSILCAGLIYVRGKGKNLISRPKKVVQLAPIVLPFFILWMIVFVVDFPRTIEDNEKTIPILGIKLNDLFDRNIVIENEDLMSKKIDEITLSKLRIDALSNTLRALELQTSDENKSVYSEEFSSQLYKQSKSTEDGIRKQAERGIKILKGRNLSFATFNNVEMRKLNAVGVDFSHASFFHVDLEGSNVLSSNFSNVYIEKSNLSNIKAHQTNFTFSNLDSVEIDSGNFNRANFDNANIAFSKLMLSFLFNISAKESTWVMNDLSASAFSFSNFEEALFLMNNYQNTNFLNAETTHSRFFTRDFFIDDYQRVFGSSYASKKLTPEEIRTGFSQEYIAVSQLGLIEDVYESPESFFYKLKKTYEFFMSAAPDFPEPSLSAEQFDQLSIGVKVQKGGHQSLDAINYTNVDTFLKRKCLDNKSRKSIIKQMVDELPKNLSRVRWAKGIGDQDQLAAALDELIKSTLKSLQETCKPDITLKELNIPKKIPYLFRAVPSIEIRFIEHDL